MSDCTAGGLLMGWRLAEEVAWARPERPGPEWWTLMDIAQDANDETRQGWPGRDYLATRAKKSLRTIDRYIETLVKDGRLICAKRAARGRRPVYEIPALLAPPSACDTDDVARSGPEPVDNPGQRATQTMSHVTPSADVDVRQNRGQRATKPGSACDTNDVAPPVSTPVTTPVTTYGPAVNGHLEEGRPRAASSEPRSSAGPGPGPPPVPPPEQRQAEEAERQRQINALAQLMENANAAPA